MLNYLNTKKKQHIYSFSLFLSANRYVDYTCMDVYVFSAPNTHCTVLYHIVHCAAVRIRIINHGMMRQVLFEIIL